jgi:hypothetical protein
MSSLSLVQSCLWTVTRWVLNLCALIKVRSLCCTRGTHRVTVQRQDWTRVSELMASLSLVQSCLWTVTRLVPLVQQKLLTFITGYEFTQPCSILSLNSDTMCAAALGAPIVSLFKEKIEQGWVNSCAVIKVRSFCCTGGSCLWTVTRWVTLLQQKLLTFITAHEFTQPYSILSLNSDTMGAPSAAETSYLRVTVQRQDWTRLSELMCCDKGKKFLLH